MNNKSGPSPPIREKAINPEWFSEEPLLLYQQVQPLTRRAFDLQMYRISPAFRRKALRRCEVDDLPTVEKRQIIFANFRRRVVIDQHDPFEFTQGDVVMCPDFRDAWMDDCGLSHGTEIIVTPSTLCDCKTCNIHADTNRYHVHWNICDRIDADLRLSVGIVILDPQRMVMPDWELPKTLNTQQDYVHAIGIGIDDALHDCGMETLTDEQFQARLAKYVRSMLDGRAVIGLKVANIQPRIIEQVGRTDIHCSVDLTTGTHTETIRGARALHHSSKS